VTSNIIEHLPHGIVKVSTLHNVQSSELNWIWIIESVLSNAVLLLMLCGANGCCWCCWC